MAEIRIAPTRALSYPLSIRGKTSVTLRRVVIDDRLRGGRRRTQNHRAVETVFVIPRSSGIVVDASWASLEDVKAAQRARLVTVTPVVVATDSVQVPETKSADQPTAQDPTRRTPKKRSK